MSTRPQRITIRDEIGREAALAEGASAFMQLSTGPKIVFLGLGPNPLEFPGKIRRGKPTWYMEAPQFESAMDDSWNKGIPATFRRIKPEDLTPDFLQSATIFCYRQNIKLFPSFWGPVMAACKLGMVDHRRETRRNEVWLPGTDQSLLMRELEWAFGKQGFEVRTIDPELGAAGTLELLRKRRPKIFFSVNFQGLDPLGETYYLLRAEGVDVASWCVDNPFHLLSRIKSRYWTEMNLFVTDKWFLTELLKLGAKKPKYLPLAAGPVDPDVDRPPPPGADDPALGLSRRLVFVGRSSFPNKRGFFAGQSLDQERMSEAAKLLLQGKRPDFAWWMDELDIRPPWPGTEVRAAGFAAEETSRQWRALCLKTAAGTDSADSVLGGVTVFGDPDWKNLIPSLFDIRPVVDYYGPLFNIYARSGVSLNLTSMLLPSGLTQRHFDVWAAGGFLITDATPGMDLFPAELAEPVTFHAPEEIQQRADRFMPKRNQPNVLREELGREWRRLILSEHTYVERVQKVMAELGMV